MCIRDSFCVVTVIEDEDDQSVADWFSTITLPLAIFTGVLCHMCLTPERSPQAWVVLVIWLAGIVGLYWEAVSFSSEDGAFSLLKIVASVVIAATIFGPGLLLGALWLRESFQS